MNSRLRFSIFSLFALASALVLASCQTTELEKRNYLSSYRGMETTRNLAGGTSMVRESDPRTMARYRKVLVEPVRYIPPRNPDPKHKGPTRAEAQQLTAAFEKALKEELGRHYELTSRRSRDTLAVRAALTELRPSQPALFILNYLPYAGAATTGLSLATGETLGAGSTSMEAEVVDAASRRQLYALVERSKGSKLQPSGLEKWGQSEQAMKIWARKIRRGIQRSAPVATANVPRATQGQQARANQRQQPASASRNAAAANKEGNQGPFAGLFKQKEKPEPTPAANTRRATR